MIGWRGPAAGFVPVHTSFLRRASLSRTPAAGSSTVDGESSLLIPWPFLTVVLSWADHAPLTTPGGAMRTVRNELISIRYVLTALSLLALAQLRPARAF